jgi:CheY-like chemotaxis protein
MSSILLIEDNEDTRIALRRLLEIDSHEVWTAADGEAGYVFANRYKPDIVITDYMMPRMDGLSLIARIQNNSSLSDTQIILISAFCKDKETILAAGADICLQKPFDYDQLAEAIEVLEDARYELKTVNARN